MINVFNFSGGRTSALMTIESYEPGDIVIFCDTGREHEKTYKFINDFEAFENIPVMRLQKVGGWAAFLEKWGGIPNVRKRECTVQMKIKVARKYLVENGIKEYRNFIGFRWDEKNRVVNYECKYKKVEPVFPLFRYGIDKMYVLDYWDKKPYNLQLDPILGNCDACFMKGKAAIIRIYQQFPELAAKWINDEKNNRKGYTYLNGISHEQMLNIANELNQKQCSVNLSGISPEFNCGCGN